MFSLKHSRSENRNNRSSSSRFGQCDTRPGGYGRNGRKSRVSTGVFVLLLLLLASLAPLNAVATPITLSDASSDGLQLQAVDMNATISFSVIGTELTLSITNSSTAPADPLAISEIFFNASSAVTGLTLVSAPVHSSLGGLLWEGLTGTGATGFGTFDFSLKAERVGNGQARETGSVDSGQTVNFLFAIAGFGVTASDFGAEFSIPDIALGEVAAMGAALFKGAGNEAYGADTVVNVVPEPGTALLLGLGLIGLARRPQQNRKRLAG